MSAGEDVIVFDNFSRPGVERNLKWLAARHGNRLHSIPGDLRDPVAVEAAVADAGNVVHLAAQVAVTSSLADPLDDFTVNAQGTLTVLEAIRRLAPQTPLVFASTNKVYGDMADLKMERRSNGHVPVDPNIRDRGIDETRSLSFCPPTAVRRELPTSMSSTTPIPLVCVRRCFAKAVSMGPASSAPKTRDGLRTS